jgi:hypothetical protein
MKENKILECLDSNLNPVEFDSATTIKLSLLGRADSEAFLISKYSLERVMKHQWYLDKAGYPKSYRARGHTLHRYLLGKQESGYVIDHINRNKLDNRLENLRIITAKENSYNRSKNSNSNNLYKGVIARSNKFYAQISRDKIKTELGPFETQEEAAKMYDLMAEDLFGEYAGKNFE